MQGITMQRLIDVNRGNCASLIFSLAFMLLSQIAHGAGTCSTAIGKVTLNEYSHQAGFVEINQRVSGYDMTGWKVRVYRSSTTNTSTCGSGCNERSLPAAERCGDYQVVSFTNSQVSTNADIVLLDASNNVVDILRARTGSTVSQYYPQPVCSFIGPSTDLPNVNNAQKGLDRLPDGTGAWRNTPGTGSGSYQTRCAVNRIETSSVADLSLTKTVDYTSVTAIGSQVVFTLTLKNNGPATANSVQVTDLMQSGLSYVTNSTPTLGNYNASTGLWDIPSLLVNQTAMMTLTASVNASGSWNNTATALSDNSDNVPGNNTATVSVILGSSNILAPQKFNACEMEPCTATGRLYTKRVGDDFELYFSSLNNVGAVETSFNGSVTIDLLANSQPVTKSANQCPASQDDVIGLGSVAFNKGVSSLVVPALNQAYRDVTVRFNCSGAQCPEGGLIWCAADVFAVRPSALTVLSNASANAPAANAMPIIKAGQRFDLQVSTSPSAGYFGAINIDSTKLSAQLPSNTSSIQSGGVVGILSLSSPLLANTIYANNTTYSEVGYLYLSAGTLRDDNYTAVDQPNDCHSSTISDVYLSDNFSNGKVGCSIGNTSVAVLGRFVPDHFDVSLNTPVFAPACNSFSYVGQPIRYATNPQASFSAKNANGLTTQNYSGGYWKISPTNALYPITTSYADASQLLSVLYLPTPIIQDNHDGTGTLSIADTSSNILAITRSDPLAPFNAEIALSFDLRDTDAVAVANVNGVASANPVRFGSASTGNGIAFTGGNKSMRWGRLAMQNSYGSELIPLAVPLFSEYFNGSSFVRNTADQCTALTLSTQLSLRSPTTSTGTAQPGNAVMTLGLGSSQATLANVPFANGAAGLTFSAPGSGNTGYIDITGNFTSLPWLLFDWDHDGNHNDSPSSRASFGIYEGNTRQIYKREVY